MNEIEELINLIIQFRDERNWEQFHNSKDLAIALSIEAAELNELFLWQKPEEVDKWKSDKVEKIKEELADVLVYALMLVHKYGFDVGEIIRDKMKKNGEKYPVEKAKGNAAKYTEL